MLWGWREPTSSRKIHWMELEGIGTSYRQSHCEISWEQLHKAAGNAFEAGWSSYSVCLSNRSSLKNQHPGALGCDSVARAVLLLTGRQVYAVSGDSSVSKYWKNSECDQQELKFIHQRFCNLTATKHQELLGCMRRLEKSCYFHTFIFS